MDDTREGGSGGVTAEDLKKALKRAAKKTADKRIKKALTALFTDKESPLNKAFAGLATKKDIEGVAESYREELRKVIAVLVSEGDAPEQLQKAHERALRLVPDDDAKTGEPQTPEAKKLRKVIEEANAALAKIADAEKGGGDASGTRFAASL